MRIPVGLGALFLLVGCDGPERPADLILQNAQVWTVDAGDSRHEAVAVAEGVILAVGSDEEVLAHRDSATQVLDLGGAFVTPGFNDNHTHFASAARFLEFNIMATSTQEEFVERVEDVVGRLQPGDWIVGGYWGAYDQWALGSSGGDQREPFAPNISRVEAVTAEYPLFIQKFDRSEYAVNRAALTAAGLDPEDPRAEGLTFQRDDEGKLTGIVWGEGVRRTFRPPAPSYQRRVEQTRNALAAIRRAGVTNISDMSDDTQLQIFKELRESGELTARVHFRYGLERWEELAKQDIKVGSGDAWIRLGSLKGHIDGIMGTSGARFFEPYRHQPDNRGLWRRLMHDDEGNLDPEGFYRLMADADAAGLQLTVHAIGDEANHLLLNFLERLNETNGSRDRRFRLVHAQVIAPADFKRLGELGVIAEVQPYHLSDDMRWMEERIGYERCKGAYAFKSIADSGALLTFGTDWPGTSAAEYPINPMLGIYAAVSRQTTTGSPAQGWFPEQRISVQDALRAYTFNSAYANFEEDTKGSIEVGKLADITVLDRNPMEVATPAELLQIQPLYTIVDGEIVYAREER